MSRTWPLLAGRYRLLGVIGSGGMAVVHRARDELLRRDVAVKVLRDQFATDRAFVERFREEARNAASLSHPNIAAVFDTGTADRLEYIVLELVPGPNLQAVLAAHGRLPVAEAARIAIAAADALDAAHAGGIVHRDVKPGNLLLGPGGIVKVVDFGIARALGHAQTTRPGLLLGSLPYASPEHLTGEPVGPTSDVYSLGVVLYEMLTGVNPWAGPSELAAAVARLERHPEPPSRLAPDVPPQVDAVVMRALERDAARRYPAARELATALRDVTQTRRPVAAPATTRAALSATALGLLPASRSSGGERTQLVARSRLNGTGRRRATSALLVAALAAAALGIGAVAGLLPAGERDGPGTSLAAGGVVTSPTTPRTRSDTPGPTPAARAASPASPAPSDGASLPAPSLHPEEVVARFYFLVAEERFDEASSLWTASLRERYPPREYIDRRFGPSVTIEVGRVEEVERDADEATVTVEVTERRADGDVRRFTGTWDLVLTGEGWLLHDPAF